MSGVNSLTGSTMMVACMVTAWLTGAGSVAVMVKSYLRAAPSKSNDYRKDDRTMNII